MNDKIIEIANPRTGGFWYWLVRYGVLSGCLLFLVGGYLGIAGFVWVVRDMPAVPDLERYEAEAPFVNLVYAADGTLLAELGTQRPTLEKEKTNLKTEHAIEYRAWVSYEEIPAFLIKAVLATEDRRFFEHHGLDIWGLGRALWTDIRTGTLAQGGSTITQQLAKSYLFQEKSYLRKIKEGILARWLESKYTKKQILVAYLNQIPFGHVKDRGVDLYGIQAAARFYFNKDINQLNESQMAIIAGMIQAPSRYSPFSGHMEKTLARRDQVLNSLHENKEITPEELKHYQQQDTWVMGRQDVFRERSPHFVDQVKQQLKKLSSMQIDTLHKGGYRIETTVMPFLDVLAAENTDHAARALDKRQGFRKPVMHLLPSQKDAFVQASLAVYGNEIKEQKHYLGLVVGAEPSHALIQIGEGIYPLPLRNMDWAARYSRVDDKNDNKIQSTKQALKAGDVVWVRLKPTNPPARFSEYSLVKKVQETTIPGKPEVFDMQWASPTNYTLPKNHELLLEQTPQVQSALYTIDWHTGYVLAMVGSRDYDESPLNRVFSCRQPGSAYKPVYYSLALDRGYSFDSLWHDKVNKEEIDPATGKPWELKNVDGKHESIVTMERALTWSKNPPSVEIFKLLGAKAVQNWADALGFKTPVHADDALALGASCVQMNELANVFALFARNGFSLQPVLIKRILDRTGNVVFDQSAWDDVEMDSSSRLKRLMSTALREEKPVIAPRTAFLTTKLMRNVVSEGHSSLIRAANLIAAGKTGTSSRTADVWFVGFTSQLLTAVWVGDDTYKRQLGRTDASFTISVPMWTRYMYAATRFLDMPLTELPWEVPPGVKTNDRGGPLPKGMPIPPAQRESQPKQNAVSTLKQHAL